jgi:MFS family permease
MYDRSYVTALGCFIWGTMTLLFSFTNTIWWGAFTWAWNGIGLSFIIPNSQSLVADYYTDRDRGKAFGTLYTTGVQSSASASLSTLFVLPFSACTRSCFVKAV